MHLYVEPMDAVVVEVSDDGRVRYESNRGVGSPEVNESEWSTPTLQERRAILYAANNEIAALNELLEALEARKS
jgi:acyl-CoA reductase-like NAD-dependent aldehyde dehydrogenase